MLKIGPVSYYSREEIHAKCHNSNSFCLMRMSGWQLCGHHVQPEVIGWTLEMLMLLTSIFVLELLYVKSGLLECLRLEAQLKDCGMTLRLEAGSQRTYFHAVTKAHSTHDSPLGRTINTNSPPRTSRRFRQVCTTWVK